MAAFHPDEDIAFFDHITFKDVYSDNTSCDAATEYRMVAWNFPDMADGENSAFKVFSFGCGILDAKVFDPFRFKGDKVARGGWSFRSVCHESGY